MLIPFVICTPALPKILAAIDRWTFGPVKNVFKVRELKWLNTSFDVLSEPKFYTILHVLYIN